MIMQLDFTKKNELQSIDSSVEHTKSIIASLKKKVREHNTLGSEKVTFNQLKEVFLEGIKSRVDGTNLPLNGFARVNMFLRLFKSGSIAHEFKTNGQIKASKSTMLDFSQYISPSSQDFIAATEDVQKYNLDFDFQSADDLYFADYEHLPSRLEEYL
jgi:hypothetical protein